MQPFWSGPTVETGHQIARPNLAWMEYHRDGSPRPSRILLWWDLLNDVVERLTSQVTRYQCPKNNKKNELFTIDMNPLDIKENG